MKQLLKFMHRDPVNFPGFQEKDLELQVKVFSFLSDLHSFGSA